MDDLPEEVILLLCRELRITLPLSYTCTKYNELLNGILKIQLSDELEDRLRSDTISIEYQINILERIIIERKTDYFSLFVRSRFKLFIFVDDEIYFHTLSVFSISNYQSFIDMMNIDGGLSIFNSQQIGNMKTIKILEENYWRNLNYEEMEVYAPMIFRDACYQFSLLRNQDTWGHTCPNKEFIIVRGFGGSEVLNLAETALPRLINIMSELDISLPDEYPESIRKKSEMIHSALQNGEILEFLETLTNRSDMIYIIHYISKGKPYEECFREKLEYYCYWYFAESSEHAKLIKNKLIEMKRVWPYWT